MRNSPYEHDDQVPAPRLVAAWDALHCLAPERVPLWAAHWLAQGMDGPALRALAGLSGHDPHEVREVLSDALRDAGVLGPDPEAMKDVERGWARSSVTLVFRDVARLCLEGRAAPRWVVDKVNEIVEDEGYDDWVLDQPLGRLFGMDDAWGAPWSRPDPELDELVRTACSDQIASVG